MPTIRRRMLGWLYEFILISDKINFKTKSIIRNKVRDFPGGPVVKNPPSNAGDTGWITGQGTKIPHAVGQLSHAPQLLSLAASTREPACRKLQSPHALEPVHHN